MPSTRDIRRRIKSVKNTKQITKAMEMVAASKMKRAQNQATAGRPYADLMNEVLVNLRETTEPDAHPLLQTHDEGKRLVIVISTDKGLCGGLNTNLFRVVNEQVPDDAEFVTVGIKGRQVLSRLKRNLLADFHVKDPVSFAETKIVSKFVVEKYLEGEYASVKVVFSNFVNTLTQTPLIETLLPVRPIDLGRTKEYLLDNKGVEDAAEDRKARVRNAEAIAGGGYIFEPTPDAVLDAIVPQYVNYLLYQMVLEARASEHSARMVAMKNATENADGLIKDLTLEYNKIRQASITNELLEITTAMRALE